MFQKRKKSVLELSQVSSFLVMDRLPLELRQKKQSKSMIVLDEICQLAKATEELNGNTVRTPQYLLDKHYYRKHGKTAYYGQ